MGDSGAMRAVERRSNFDRDLQGLVEWERASGEPNGQRGAVEILHNEKGRAMVFADVMQCTDMRMAELRDRAALADESRPEIRVVGERVGQDLDRNSPPQTGVAGCVDFAHAAGPDEGDDLIRTEMSALGE